MFSRRSSYESFTYMLIQSKIPIELIYLNGSGDFSQRTVIVRKIYEDRVLVYCMQKQQVRMLKLPNILSVDKVRNNYQYA